MDIKFLIVAIAVMCAVLILTISLIITIVQFACWMGKKIYYFFNPMKKLALEEEARRVKEEAKKCNEAYRSIWV